MRVNFTGSCLQQPKVSYTHGTIVNIYIVYELVLLAHTMMIANTKKALFDAVTITKDANIDKYGYSGYGIGFDRK